MVKLLGKWSEISKELTISVVDKHLNATDTNISSAPIYWLDRLCSKQSFTELGFFALCLRLT